MKSKLVACLAATALAATIVTTTPAMAFRGGFGGFHGGGFGGFHGGGFGGFRGGMMPGRGMFAPGMHFGGAPFAGRQAFFRHFPAQHPFFFRHHFHRFAFRRPFFFRHHFGAFRHPFFFRHHHFRHIAFVGVPFAYGYGATAAGGGDGRIGAGGE